MQKDTVAIQRVMIVGASSGIGHALALRYAESGIRVAVLARRTELLEDLRTLHPDRIVPKRLDVRDVENVPTALEDALGALGGLDLLILSSGTGEINEDLDFALERPTLETNVLGFTAVVDWAYNTCQRQGHGQIVAITSVAALRGEPSAPAYAASKAYQRNYLEGLRKKSRRSGSHVIVTEIRPGFVDTDMAKGDGLFWVAPVDKAARQIIRAIRSQKTLAYVTKRWALAGWIFALLPNGIYDRF